MPLKIKCPACSAVIGVPDTAVGKQVRCPKCQKAVPVKRPAPPPPVDDDDDDDVPAPPPAKTGVKSAPGKPNGKSMPKPPPGKKPAKPPRDDDDDDDDTPAPPKKKGSPVFLILGIVGGVFLLLCLGCTGSVLYFVYGIYSAANQGIQAFNNIQTDLQNQGGGTNPFDPIKPGAKVEDLNGALAAIKSQDKNGKYRGAEWLAKAPLDPQRQAEVALRPRRDGRLHRSRDEGPGRPGPGGVGRQGEHPGHCQGDGRGQGRLGQRHPQEGGVRDPGAVQGRTRRHGHRPLPG